MNHPFNLNLSELKTIDLDFEESLTPEESATVSGSLSLDPCRPRPRPCPRPRPPRPRPICRPIEPPICHTPIEPPICHRPIEPPIFTTLALGEEGGCFDPLS